VNESLPETQEANFVNSKKLPSSRHEVQHVKPKRNSWLEIIDFSPQLYWNRVRERRKYLTTGYLWWPVVGIFTPFFCPVSVSYHLFHGCNFCKSNCASWICYGMNIYRITRLIILKKFVIWNDRSTSTVLFSSVRNCSPEIEHFWGAPSLGRCASELPGNRINSRICNLVGKYSSVIFIKGKSLTLIHVLLKIKTNYSWGWA